MNDPPRRGRLRAALLGWILFSALIFGAPSASAGDTPAPAPWEATPFAASPSAVLDAARAVSASAEVTRLFEEGTFRYDEQGRCTLVYRDVYRIDSPSSVDDWSTLEAGYAPWHQARPSLKARVVTADGRAHVLDQRTVDEAPAADESQGTHSDRRLVRAPLPAVAAGAVVETEVEIADTQPLFAAGERRRFYLLGGAGRVTRLVVDAPAALPLRAQALLLEGVTPRRVEAEGRVRTVYEQRSVTRVGEIEGDLTPDAPRWPQVVVSTGRSWRDVAAAYAATVSAVIEGAALEAIVAEVRASLGGRAERDAMIGALLERMHRDVRYTGIEFDDASIVPWKPAQVLARRYGDCKDQAALLVALLAADHIEAHVALLRVGSRDDLSAPDLPGLGQFDHAIVFVPASGGGAPLWIDATDEFARPGELPAGDCGRLALVAAPSTDGLVTTPEARAKDRSTLETREVRLREDAGADVFERTLLHGSRERDYRRAYRSADRKKTRSDLEGYGKEAFGATTLTAMMLGDAFDLSRPYEMTLSYSGCTRLPCDEEAATVELDPAEPLSGLPRSLSQEPEEGAPPRKSELFVPEPFESEVRWRLEPPPGYAPRSLPDALGLEWGPARYTRTVTRAEGGRVDVAFRFVLDRRRLSPEEVAAVRAGVKALRAEKTIALRFEHAGQALLAAGKIPEGIATMRATAAAATGTARPRVRLANALLGLGLGEPARAAAREACLAEPGSLLAWRAFGWALQHDLAGRQRRGDFDRAGAIAAYRRALEIDPKDGQARGNLAILLEFDAAGRRYAAGASLAEAIDEYRALREKAGWKSLDWNLVYALWWADRVPEAKAFMDTIAVDDAHRGMYVATLAATDGTGEALRHAEHAARDPATRRQVLAGAATLLAQSRRYPEALALVETAAAGAPNASAYATWAANLRGMRRRDPETLPVGDPATVVQRFALSAFRGVDRDTLSRFLTPEAVRALFSEDEQMDDLLGGMRASLASTNGKVGPLPEMTMDAYIANVKIAREGDIATGYRVRISSAATRTMEAFVVTRGAEFRIASLEQESGMGIEALACLDRGDEGAARRILDQVREEMNAVAGEDPLGADPFPRLWAKGDRGDADRIRRAAAALIEADAPAVSAPLLEAARARASGDEARTLDVALMRSRAFRDEPAKALELARRLHEGAPDSWIGRRHLASVLMDAGRIAEARTVAATLLEPAYKRREPSARLLIAQLEMHDGRIDAAEAALQPLVESGRLGDSECNELAWLHVVAGRVAAADVDLARRAATRDDPKRRRGAQHTLATVFAELGRVAEARETLVAMLDESGSERPEPHDWYILGRMAEQVGERDAAVAAYRRVKPSRRERDEVGSTVWLARRRLNALGEGEAGVR